MLDEKIRSHFKNRNNIHEKDVEMFLEKNPSIKNYVDDILNDVPEWENERNVVQGLVDRFELSTCEFCGKVLSYSQCKAGNHYCSLSHASMADATRKKVEDTCRQKYGESNPAKLDHVKEKIRNTCRKKYGVDNVSKLKNVKEKKSSVRRHKLWMQIQEWHEFIHPLFNEDDLETKKSKKQYIWRCEKCGNEFRDRIHKTTHNKDFPYMPRCFKCYPYKNYTSNEEIAVLEFVNRLFPYAKKSMTLISPFELDIVIPELNLAIEFNGDYWHSLSWWHRHHKTTNGYMKRHLSKVELCNEKGYRLLHIWENEWKKDQLRIENMLLDVLNGNEKLSFIDDVIELDRSWYNNVNIERLSY